MFAAIKKLATIASFRHSARQCKVADERFRRCESLTSGRVCFQAMRQAALEETSRFLNNALSR